MELCVALDCSSVVENLALAKKIKDYNIWLKIGLRAFIRDGYAFIEDLKAINPHFKIFLDLKLYDIPNTMADAAFEIAHFGVDMFNIHASSGTVAMKTVMERLAPLSQKPIVLAVTALTSFDETHFKAVYHQSIEQKAADFAYDAYISGVNGVVCSVYESRLIKEKVSNEFITLTPGIRPFGEESDDQKRVANLQTARDYWSDFIVVGRPIYKASDPREVVKRILGAI